LQHNHDQIPYGVPPLNGFPLKRAAANTEYGFADDATNQDVISLMATVDHAFNKDFKLRNQSMFNFVNTNVRETAGQAVGTVDRCRLRAGGQRSDGPRRSVACRSVSSLFASRATTATSTTSRSTTRPS